MLNWLSDLAVKRKVRSALNAAPRSMPTWEKLERIAIVIDDHCRTSKHEFDKFVGQTGKFVEIFFIRSNDKAPAYSDWTCISRKDFNILKLPKQEILQTLRRRDFDLVIDAAEHLRRTSALLAACIPAGLRCSQSWEYHHTELVISRESESNILNYLQEVLQYIQRITVQR